MAEVESSPKRGWFPWKTPSTRRTGFKTVAMALAACLVIMILSSAGTLFLTRRYFSPLAAEKALDEPSQKFRMMDTPSEESEPFFKTAQAPGSESMAVPPESSGDGGTEYAGVTGADTAGVERKLIRRARLTVEVPPGNVDDTSRQASRTVLSGLYESSSAPRLTAATVYGVL